ncbi:hypothetical protein DFR31_1056 [Alkalispirillum mobile]|uniref:Uncharacterized protein n=1 Tax=Alkalispirillum mobile TaxID=85925 RepID=A0A498CD02_9GAMM|nr:hypothetical protein [Alkalispirillum mobile]RLK51140.1 hypothetical protein DFR31_1056 [Alkalispirillum mobile]
MARAMTADQLRRENEAFRCTAGVSQHNRKEGFRPAFLDSETGVVYLSRNRDGSVAPFHRLDGLPEELVWRRDEQGRVLAVKPSLVSGFERDGHFFTREQAACLVIDAS